VSVKGKEEEEEEEKKKKKRKPQLVWDGEGVRVRVEGGEN
jgi:hypothetical protein